jgi:hypothetical protein
VVSLLQVVEAFYYWASDINIFLEMEQGITCIKTLNGKCDPPLCLTLKAST